MKTNYGFLVMNSNSRVRVEWLGRGKLKVGCFVLVLFF